MELVVWGDEFYARRENAGDAGDLFRATAGVALDDTTNPSSVRWDGAGSGLVISDIGDPGPVIRFPVGEPSPVDDAVAIPGGVGCHGTLAGAGARLLAE
ncbi:hypothetical protein MB27_24860 [Actinoplanes utahensis]|uniref:Uncharacterized protein n=1 Tax=Actinoplanes utahensis TaxID=1869 RepID=A0A0A6UJ86_ACTUT|nr:hypothetical protein MB27_24860 [Actinoplanes utahensis]